MKIILIRWSSTPMINSSCLWKRRIGFGQKLPSILSHLFSLQWMVKFYANNDPCHPRFTVTILKNILQYKNYNDQECNCQVTDCLTKWCTVCRIVTCWRMSSVSWSMLWPRDTHLSVVVWKCQNAWTYHQLARTAIRTVYSWACPIQNQSIKVILRKLEAH